MVEPNNKKRKVVTLNGDNNSKESISVCAKGHIQVTVQDSGVGMSSDQLANLFCEGVQFNANQLQGGKGSGKFYKLAIWILY